MKPENVLPEEINSIEKEGVTIRKGTIGAFTANIQIIESTSEENPRHVEAVEDLLSLVPALQKLQFFDFYSIKSDKVRKILEERNSTQKTTISS